MRFILAAITAFALASCAVGQDPEHARTLEFIQETKALSERHEAKFQEYLRQEQAYREDMKRRVAQNPPSIPPWPCPTFEAMRNVAIRIVEKKGVHVLSWAGRAVDSELALVTEGTWDYVYPDQPYRCDVAFLTFNIGVGLLEAEYDPAFGLVRLDSVAGIR